MSRPNPNQKPGALPPDSATPPELASGWILQGFQQVNSRFDRVDSRFDRVDSRIDRVDSRIDRVDSRLDHVVNRLRRVENILWIATGCVIIMTAIVGYVASLARDFLMLWMQQ